MNPSRGWSSAALLVLTWLITGCGEDVVVTGGTSAAPKGSSAPAKARPSATPSSAPSSSAAQAPSAAASASASPATSTSTGATAPSASASPLASAAVPPASSSSAGPASSAAAGPPALAYSDYSGPPVKPTVQAGERAWAVVPINGAWEAVKLTVTPVLEAYEDAVVVGQGDRRYRVPGAFASRATAGAALAAGDPVMASAKGTRVFGRVVEASGDKLRVKFKFAGTVEVAEVPAADVVKVDGSPFLGAPLSFKDGKVDHTGQLVNLLGGRAWVLSGSRIRSVAAADITLFPAPATLAKGAPVLAARGDVMTPGVLLAVHDDALQYEVKWDGGEDTATGTFETFVPKK